MEHSEEQNLVQYWILKVNGTFDTNFYICNDFVVNDLPTDLSQGRKITTVTIILRQGQVKQYPVNQLPVPL